MAERTCTGESGSPLCCEVARVRRRRALEDMPTAHVNARAEETGSLSSGGCQAETLAVLLETQNRLLCDILGAVNSLTAAQLATRRDA